MINVPKVLSRVNRAFACSNAMCRFTPRHEWVSPEGNGVYRIGLTMRGQKMIGDVVFLELPKIGANIQKNGTHFIYT